MENSTKNKEIYIKLGLHGDGVPAGDGRGFPGIFQNDGDGDGDGDRVVGGGEKNTGDGVPVSPDLSIFRAKSLDL